MQKTLLFLFFIALSLWQCQSSDTQNTATAAEPEPEGYALDGKPLFPPADSEAALRRKDSLLAIARDNFEQNPTALDNIIWLGRRVAYLSRYREAIDIFSEGIRQHPDAPELYRHRGHR